MKFPLFDSESSIYYVYSHILNRRSYYSGGIECVKNTPSVCSVPPHVVGRLMTRVSSVSLLLVMVPLYIPYL